MGSRMRQRLAAAVLGVGLLGGPSALAADNLVFVSGAFRRSIAVSDLAYLAETGKARGLMADVLAFAKQKPEEVSKLLKAELSIPLVLTSRLLSTRLGEAILARVAQIVYPLQASKVGIPALRAGVIQALAAGDGKLSALSFLEAYPVDEMEVNIPALLAVMNKAKSISQLVSFFTESPLDGLRGENKPAP
jgi:hypothetical protein